MTTRLIGAAIVGYGYMGEIRRRVLAASDEFRLAGIADPKPRPAGVAADTAWAASYADLLGREDVGAVFVCTPNVVAPDVVCAALAAGKHVFCEKPPGRTVADVLRMREVEARAPGRALLFGFNHRFHPAMLEAKRLVDAGELGRVLWLRGVYGKPGGPAPGRSWRADAAQSGGGILLDQGIHMLDLFRYYAGDFRRVRAVCGASDARAAVEDDAFVLLESDRGPRGALHSSATLGRPTFRLDVGLEGGYLAVEGLLTKTMRYGPETLVVGRRGAGEGGPAGQRGPTEERRHVYGPPDGSWAVEVGNFARAIRDGGRVTQCGSLDALRAMELVHAAYADAGRDTKAGEPAGRPGTGSER